MDLKLYPHNRTAYEAACALMARTGKAAVVHPTGTGKSFIGFQLCADHPGATICWLSPSEYIFKTQIENLKQVTGGEAPENIYFLTYAKLMQMDELEIKEIVPDYIILDEFHRCGAEMWGQGVQRLLDAFSGIPILGLSATHIRYLDSRRDMAQELFDGHVASQMTLGEAIVRGILNPPVYVTALYSYQKSFEQMEKRVHRAQQKAVRDAGERYLEALRRALEQAEGLDEIFARHIKEKSGKYIVFCANIEHMREMMEKAPEWFKAIDPEPHLYSAYSNDPETSKAFQQFKQDNSDHLKLLFCIDMLNEGVHVDDIAGVILFRPTVSPIVYKQQIGRALSAGRDGSAVILDIVDNVSNLYSIGAIQEEMDEAIQFYRELGEESDIVNEHFRIIDEVRECRKLFDQLENTLSASWDLMYAQAKRYFEENGDLLPLQSYVTEDGYHLGQWIVTQRINYSHKKLSASRTKRLEQIGMNWMTRNERFWEECYALAKAYDAEHGNLTVPRTEMKLSAWLTCQRKKYREDQLTEEQIQRLNAIGMVWEPEDTWMARYQEACQFYEKNGHLDIPATYVTEDGNYLGAWYRTVRGQYKDGTLSDERIALLEKIGIQWTSVKLRNWMNYYELARDYYQQHGDLNVTADYTTPDGTRLGTWISGQRYSYQKGRLSAEQIELLNQIGMSWHRDISRWERGYQYAEEYCKQNGSANPVVDYVTEDGFALGAWIATQRLKYRNGKLKHSQVERLEQLRIDWTPNESAWEKGYQHAKKYFEMHGNLKCACSFQTEDGFKLGSWIGNQKTRYRKQQLTQEQIEKLEEIGMVWNRLEEQWNEGYNHAKQYFQENQTLAVPQNYCCPDGYHLGDWLQTQKKMFRQGSLQERRQVLLEELGVRFGKNGAERDKSA